jgi:hypothetical protein
MLDRNRGFQQVDSFRSEHSAIGADINDNTAKVHDYS